MTLPTGSTWGLKSAVLGLALLSSGCTTVVVTNPVVHLDVHVAPLPFPTHQPMERSPEPGDAPIILRPEELH